MSENEWTYKKIGEIPSEKQVGGSHYLDMKIEPINFIVENNLPFMEGCVIKYVCRHKQKNGIEDINKAIHFLQMMKEFYYGEVGTP